MGALKELSVDGTRREGARGEGAKAGCNVLLRNFRKKTSPLEKK